MAGTFRTLIGRLPIEADRGTSTTAAGPRTSQLGAAAELRAARFLAEQGLRLVERNFRCRSGEIDLVMRDGEWYVFVEVRLRRNSHYGSAADSVTSGKRRRFARAAEHYLLARGIDARCRFDVVALGGPSGERIEWIPDAFRLAD